MRKTKIVCTIGPACDSEELLTEMCRAGMNVARLNFSHGTHETHKKMIEKFRAVRDRLNLPAGVMLDTKGPEIRLGLFENGSVRLETGQSFVLTTEEVLGNAERAYQTLGNLPSQLKPGDLSLIHI